MGSVRLSLRRHKSHAAGSHLLYLEQVVALFRVLPSESPALIREGVIDTGAPVSVFPQVAWQPFEQNISWLTRRNDPGVPKWCREVSGVSGGSIPVRLGSVVNELFDHLGGRLGPFEIVAMFAQDHGRMRDLLLGLGGGVFANRRLEMVYTDQAITLSDA